MKRNALACGALVLGMLAGFAVRGALETADAIPPQTQASACSETPEVPKSEPAVREAAPENCDEYKTFFQVVERTAAGYDADHRKETEGELLGEPTYRVSIANLDLGVSNTVSTSAPSRIQPERWDQDVNYAITWDAAQGWFDYGQFKPPTEEREIFRFFLSGMR